MKTYSETACDCILQHAAGIVLALFLFPTIATADCVLRPGDSIWEVSARHLSDCPVEGAPLRISSFNGCTFQDSSLESLLADRFLLTSQRTIIYVHGNWMEWDNARQRGLHVYRSLVSRSCEPINLILFTWPSERTHRWIRDVREKAELADAYAYHFADFMNQLPANRPLSIMGFSYGGAMASGALHLMAGGALEGRRLPAITSHSNIRISLIAPAFGTSELGPCGKYSLALVPVERLINLYNSSDPVLQRFRFLDGRRSPAAGFAGIDARITQPLAVHPKIRQFDCRAGTGRTHDELEYYNDCAFFSHSVDNVLGR